MQQFHLFCVTSPLCSIVLFVTSVYHVNVAFTLKIYQISGPTNTFQICAHTNIFRISHTNMFRISLKKFDYKQTCFKFQDIGAWISFVILCWNLEHFGLWQLFHNQKGDPYFLEIDDIDHHHDGWGPFYLPLVVSLFIIIIIIIWKCRFLAPTGSSTVLVHSATLSDCEHLCQYI